MEMPSLRRASPLAGLAPAILLAVLAVPALPVAAQAAPQTLALTVHVGYHDVVKSGQWMPVSIDVRNTGADFHGTIEVQPQDNFKGLFLAGDPVYVLPFTLPGGTVKHVRTFVASDVSGSPLTVRLVSGGRVLASQTASGAIYAGLLVGVLSDDPTAFDEFAAERFPAAAVAQVVHLAREDVPTSPVLLRGFDLLAIDDFAADSLTPTQRGAIEGYVAMGGNLLLGSGGAWRKTLTALPAALLPLAATGTEMLPPSAALQTAAPVEVATGAAAGRAWLRDGDRPLILEKTFGTGLVTLATFDWTQGAAAASGSTRGLLRQVGIRSGFGTRPGAATGIGGGAGASIWYGGGSSGSITQRSTGFVSALSNVPALDLPSLRLTGLLVLLYVLVVGPLNYLVLLRAGRRELAWITVPVIAVTFAGIAYGLATGTKGRSVQANQIAIVHLAGAGDQADQETYTGIFAPTRGDYSITVGGPQPAIAPIATAYGGAGGIGAGTRVQPDRAAVDLVAVTAFTLRGYATESAVPAPSLTASLSLRNGRLSGTVHNRSRIDFTDEIVAFGNVYQRLGRLAPGADLEVDLPAQAATVYGVAPTNPLVYANIAVDQVASSGVQSAREAQERTAILQSLLSSSSGPVTSPMTPILIAWTHDPLQGLQVNGATPRLQSESAVVLPLTLAGPVSGAVPAGLFTARLVDVEGEVQFGPSSIVLNGSSATYELTIPLASGARLVNPTITSANPYGMKINVPLGPPPAAGNGSPGAAGTAGTDAATLTAEAWDWSAGRWVAVPLKDNATSPLPEGSVEALTGTVRIRLTASQASTAAQMGVLSLAGSAQ